MKLTIKVNDRVYEVEVEVAQEERGPRAYQGGPRQTVQLPAAPLSTGGATEQVEDESKVCRSPLAGTVVRVTASEGDALSEGDEIMALEAMKMETVVTAPVAGTLKSIRVASGDAVRGGQVLAELE